MIDFNATLLLQVFHFVFVWWLLDTFLLKHIVAIIQSERAVRSALVSKIDERKKDLLAEQHKQDLLWVHYRKEFGRDAPNVETPPILSFSSLLCPVTLQMKKEEKEKILHETKSFLIQKVLHV